MRTIIALNLDAEDKSPKAMTDKELNKAFGLISERASQGTVDAEDIAFAKSRRSYLTDAQLKLITGLTFDEIEAEVASGASSASKYASMTLTELKEEAERLDIDLGDATKKAEIVALLDKATK